MWDVVYVKLLESQKKNDISHYLSHEKKKARKTRDQDDEKKIKLRKQEKFHYFKRWMKKSFTIIQHTKIITI